MQPIVENAVAYGMEFQDGDGEVFYQSIFERRKVDFFKLWIMVRELCRSVWKRFARGKLSLRRKVRGSVCEMSESGSSLHMEKNMESKIESEPDEGTCITLTQPKIAYGQEGELL
mgnify:CR=1 FL=1